MKIYGVNPFKTSFSGIRYHLGLRLNIYALALKTAEGIISRSEIAWLVRLVAENPQEFNAGEMRTIVNRILIPAAAKAPSLIAVYSDQIIIMPYPNHRHVIYRSETTSKTSGKGKNEMKPEKGDK
ncbi:MAG: hypothetical protein PHG97_01935 [Candidatus Margulisbacteria bacterium]|nr:hypothetical protein [Candidatus Margulisiibacteriota bacterium]